jgi:hypothetical protein
VISEYYKEVTSLGHLIQSGDCPLAFNYMHESLFYKTRVSFDDGRPIKEADVHNKGLKEIPWKK